MQRGFADDEFAADNDRVGGAGGGEACELIEETAGGLFAHFFAGIIDRRQLWLDDPGDGVIVETDDGDVFGYFYSFFFEALHENGGEEVVCDEDAVGAVFPGGDQFGGADGGGLAEVVDEDEIGFVGESEVGERLLIAFEAAGVDIAGEAGGDMGDAAAALGCEMGGGFVTCPDVIDDDAGAVGEFFDAIEENDGDAFFYERIEVIHFLGIEGEGGDEAVHAFMKQIVHIGGLLGVGFGRVADDEVIAGFCRYFFDTGEDRADELAFELMDDNTDGVRLLHPEIGGEAVGAIAHLPGGVHDTLACLYIDSGVIFEAAADGGGGEAEDARDVIDGNIFFSGHKLIEAGLCPGG